MLCHRPVPFDTALTHLDLTPVQKVVLKNRFINLLSHLSNRTFRISIMFHVGRVIVTVGSLIVPALLSIQMNGAGKDLTYWSTWVISLFVTICNALLTLFKLDKRYYYLHTCLEQLHSEGWQYIELSGKYSGFNTPAIHPTHSNQFIYFCHAIEKIRMRQVEEEYFKMVDTNQSTTNTKTSIDSLVPPTPLKEEFKRMVSYLNEGSPTPIIDKPIVSDGRRANTGSKASFSGETTYTESASYRDLSTMSIPRIVSPTIPEEVGVLYDTPGLYEGVTDQSVGT